MLTPIDIQNHTLKSTMGGYNKKDTDDFIESIQVDYEQLYKENSDLKKKITTLSEGIQYYKQMEGTLQKTLVLAEQTASETLETSKTAAVQVEKESRAKADVMLAEAKSRADALVTDAQTKAEALTRESEAKAATLERESTETAQRVTREAEERAQALTRESTETAEMVTRQAQEKADRLLSESEQKAADTISQADTKADNIMRNAHERADRIMADTKASVETLVEETKSNTQVYIDDSNRQISELTGVIRQLMAGYEDYKNKFEELLTQQLAQLKEDKYQVDIDKLNELLDSPQVALAEEQVQGILQHADELDLPVEDTAPFSASVPSFEPDTEDEILAGGLSASDAPAEQTPVETSASVTSLNIDTPSSEEISLAQGIDVAEEEAVAYKPSFAEEETTEAVPEMPEVPADLKSKLSEIDAIAAEALKDTSMPHETFDPNSTMLGTSYDDFVPAKKETETVAATQEETVPSETSFSSASFSSAASEIPPTTTDNLPTVQETYNAENYITSETYFGSADNMTYSIPDPKTPETETPSPEAAHNIPMPDFSKLDHSDDIPQTETVADVDLDALAATAAAALNEMNTESVQEEYDKETYVTSETYFGSADNMTYSIPDPKTTEPAADDVTVEAVSSASFATDSVAAEFSSGIGGVDPTAGGIIPPAPDELFTAPNEFDAVPHADDEYAVTGAQQEAEPQEAQKVTPFTFIDADK